MILNVDNKLIVDLMHWLKGRAVAGSEKLDSPNANVPWLQVAIGETGVEEIAGKESNPRVDEYLATVDLPGDDDIPWCSAFVNWVMLQCGRERTKSGMAKSWLSLKDDITLVKPGAIAVFNRGRDPSYGHVGIALDENKEYIYLLGGNQRNRVGITMYNKKSLAGLRWPKELANV